MSRGIGYPSLWPSKDCPQPLDVSNEFTFEVIDGILSGNITYPLVKHVIYVDVILLFHKIFICCCKISLLLNEKEYLSYITAYFMFQILPRFSNIDLFTWVVMKLIPVSWKNYIVFFVSSLLSFLFFFCLLLSRQRNNPLECGGF